MRCPYVAGMPTLRKSCGVLYRHGVTWLFMIGMAGCAVSPLTPIGADAAQAEIRSRIGAIREAILGKSAAGIIRDATPDWTFTGADGVTFDRAGYLKRTETLFARVEAIESLETKVVRIDFVASAEAEVEIAQAMVRIERDATTGARTRLALRYRERQQWVRTAEGWKVRRVQFIGTPERRMLPLAEGDSGEGVGRGAHVPSPR